jgi:hypothetical protein
VAASNSPSTVLAEIRQHGGYRFSQVSKWFPSARGTGHANPATVWRYAIKGVPTPFGRIHLEFVRCGMSYVTSEAAVERFVTALTSASMPADTTPAPARSESTRRKASAAAGKRLQAMGA